LGVDVIGPELMQCYTEDLKPMAEALRLMGRSQEALELEEIIEEFRLAS
jgi:hypothetical protein